MPYQVKRRSSNPTFLNACSLRSAPDSTIRQNLSGGTEAAAQPAAIRPRGFSLSRTDSVLWRITLLAPGPAGSGLYGSQLEGKPCSPEAIYPSPARPFGVMPTVCLIIKGLSA